MKRLSLIWLVLIGFFLLAVISAGAQTTPMPITLQVFPAQDSLTLYVLGDTNVSLDGFAYQIRIDGEARNHLLQSYPSFGISFSSIPTPICFSLIRGENTAVLPQICDGITTLIQRLSDADVFWIDLTLSIVLLPVRDPVGICPAGSSLCEFTIAPPASAPVPQPSTASAFDGSTPFSGPNEEWTVQLNDSGSIPFVLVPAGCFTMGSEDIENASPPTHQCLRDSYWIGYTEVSNAQYAQCVDEGSCDVPMQADEYYNPDSANNPVGYVTRAQAAEFCTWAGGRLPTEREWEFAARGPSSWIYPWGNEWDGTRANVNSPDDPYAGLAPVDSIPEGASWIGALHMDGNVREWTHSLQSDYPYNPNDWREEEPQVGSIRTFIVRGNSFSYDDPTVAVADRSFWDSDTFGIWVGIRCVGDYAG